MNLSKKIREINHWRIDAGRALALKIIRFFFDRASSHLADSYISNKDFAGSIKKILVLRLDGKLGDCVTSTGFFMRIHEAMPDAEITVLTAPQTAQIYQSFDFLKVYPIKKGVLGTLKAWWILKKYKFDISVNTSHMMAARTVFLMSATASRMKISMNCSDYPLFTDHALFDVMKDHVTVRYQRVLDKMRIPAKDLSYVIPLSEQATVVADEHIQKIGAPYIVINSFAGARFRSLSEDSTVALVKYFLEKYPNHKVVSIGNFGDLHILKEWQARHSIEGWFVFPKCGDIFVNCRLIEKSDLVISPDTAVVHLACAFKKNLIAIYRTDTAQEKNVLIWAPYGCHHKVVLAKAQPDVIDADINKFDIREMSLD